MHMRRTDLEGADELSSAVFLAFLRVFALHRQLRLKVLAERGVHPGQARCLGLLMANEGIAQRDLAGALHVSAPTLSRMLGALERSGAVERRPDDVDRRLTRVYSTARGRDLADVVRRASDAYVAETVGALQPEDRVELARLLDSLGDRLAQALEAKTGATAGQGSRCGSGVAL